MKATTIMRAYRQARALSNRDVYDRKSWRITVACMKRLERVCSEYDQLRQIHREQAQGDQPSIEDIARARLNEAAPLTEREIRDTLAQLADDLTDGWPR